MNPTNPMLSLKAALAAVLQPQMEVLSAAISRPVVVTLGYPQDAVARPIVALIRKSGQPRFYLGNYAGPFVPEGAPQYTPDHLTEMLFEEQVIMHLEVVDNLMQLELLYTSIIPVLVANSSNFAAAGFANMTFEVGEEMMSPVELDKSRWYYGVPITVTATQQIHDRGIDNPVAPYDPITTITVPVTVSAPSVGNSTGVTVTMPPPIPAIPYNIYNLVVEDGIVVGFEKSTSVISGAVDI